MRITRIVAQLVIFLGLASLGQIPHESAYAATASQDVAVSPQYDTTHVYVAPEEFDRFVASLIATFGGTTTKQGVFTVTPAPSSTMSRRRRQSRDIPGPTSTARREPRVRQAPMSWSVRSTIRSDGTRSFSGLAV